MTKQTWTVYTAEAMTPDASNPGYNVVATQWTEDGPQDKGKTVASLVGVAAAEAERQATELQRRYDGIRNGIVPA